MLIRARYASLCPNIKTLIIIFKWTQKKLCLETRVSNSIKNMNRKKQIKTLCKSSKAKDNKTIRFCGFLFFFFQSAVLRIIMPRTGSVVIAQISFINKYSDLNFIQYYKSVHSHRGYVFCKRNDFFFQK